MKHIVFRILAGLVLIAAIAGIAFFAYNAGVTHGVAQNIQMPAVQNGGQAYPAYGMPFWRPFPFFGFGCFGLLIPFFLLFLAFGAARGMLWGPRFGMHMMHHGHGSWGRGESGEDVPPMFAEWHKRAHGEAPAEEKKA